MTTRQTLDTTLKQWESEPILQFIPHFFHAFPKGRLYLVGGAVRDAAMGLKGQKDFDFVVRNVSGGDIEQFLRRLGKVDLVGKTFGVYKFVPHRLKGVEPLDIALPRIEHAFGTGGYKAFHVESQPDLPIEKDLERRDFTMNAMAVELSHAHPLSRSELIDPFDGMEDVAQGVLRAVGNPDERFQEDYSRMLRALRFSCTLRSSIEPETWQAIQRLMPHINDEMSNAEGTNDRIVPYEVVAKEFLKTFYAQPLTAFDLYDASGGFAALLPEVLATKGCPQPIEYHSEGDVWTHTRLAMQKLMEEPMKKEFPDDPITIQTILGVLFHDIGKPLVITQPKDPATDRYSYHGHDKMGADHARSICLRLKLSSQPRGSHLHVDSDDIHWIISKHLLLLNSKIEEMKASTIERYFFSPTVPGIELLQVILADSLATIPPNGSPHLEHFHHMKERIDDLIRTSGSSTIGLKRGLPPPLISGSDVMGAFQLESGPKIGKLLKIVREAQLNGEITSRQEALYAIATTLSRETRLPTKSKKESSASR